MKDLFRLGQEVPEAYYDSSEAILETRLNAAFENCMGIPSAIFATEFRNLVMEVFRTEAPRLRCSAARAIVEGRLEGVPRPASGFNPNVKKQLNQFLLLCDVIETIARMWQEKADKAAAEDHKEVEAVKETVQRGHQRSKKASS